MSTLVVELGMSRYLGRLLQPVMAPLFRVNGSCAAALALGLSLIHISRGLSCLPAYIRNSKPIPTVKGKSKILHAVLRNAFSKGMKNPIRRCV